MYGNNKCIDIKYYDLTTYLDPEFCFPFLSSTYTAVPVDLPERKVGAHEGAEPGHGTSRALKAGAWGVPGCPDRTLSPLRYFT